VVEDTGDDGGDLEGVSVREQYTESNGATGYASTAVQVEAVEQQKQHESQLPLLEQQHQDWIFTQQAAASAELKPWDWLKEGTSLLAVHGGTGHQGRQYTGGLLQPWSLQETMDVIADVYRAKVSGGVWRDNANGDDAGGVSIATKRVCIEWQASSSTE
jgi:hypothetical protein